MKLSAILFSLSILFVAFFNTSCSKLDIKKGTPSCVKNKIQDFNSTACEEGANVKSYEFQAMTVFVFDPGTCGADMTSEVIDEECNTLGYLGGIMGNSTINGESFESAEFKCVIWEK